MRHIGLFFLLTVYCFSIQAQKVLVLENPWRAKRIYFQPGDFLVFKTKDGNAKYDGYLEAVTDTAIVLVKVVKVENAGDATNNTFRDYVPMSEIKYLYGESTSYWQYFRGMVAVSGTIAGGYLMGTSVFNHYYLDAPIDKTSMTIATTLLGTGILFRLLGKNRWRLGNRWRLRAMDPMF